jgi:hypothetical protein
MKLDEQVFEALEKIVFEVLAGEVPIDWVKNNRIKLFNEDMKAEIQFGKRNGNELMAFFFIKDYRGQLDLQFWVEENRFIIFEMLEKTIWWMYQELQNNDPVSFTYGFDADHNSAEYIGFTVQCTDYMS